jgi:CheY-like chemotaxis protein
VSTPIVFLSGEHNTDKHFEALNAGGDDFLSKPIRPKHLISAVTNRLRRARHLKRRAHAQNPRDPISGLYDRAINTAERTATRHDYALRYMTPFQAEFAAAARDQGVDPEILYGIARQESRFVPGIVSSAGAIGLMQLMPGTARWVAKQLTVADYSPARIANVDLNTQLGAFYFNSPDESQIWVDLDPQPTGGGEAPVRLNFTIKFRGRELDTTPTHATIRVTSNSFVAPTHIRLPVLTLHLADDTVIDLTGPGSVYSFTASCQTCPSDTLVTDIPFTVLEQMTTSSVIVVNTLGFDGKLVSEDVAAMRRLVAAVKDGATVKP